MESGQQVLDRVIRKMQKLQESDKIARKVALSIHTLLEKRIFEPSTKDSADIQVGNRGGLYSPTYIQLRRRAGYGERDATNIELAGVIKTTGKTGKGGQAKYRTSGQMRSDFKVRPSETAKGNPTWGHGFSNQFNYQKSIWVEQRYKTNIFSELTPAEARTANQMIERYVADILK